MKKLPLYLTLSLFAALIFTSCKKDYTCACTVSVPFTFDTVINYKLEDKTKKNAKRLCENNAATIKTTADAFIHLALASSGMEIPGGTTGLVNASCELK